MCDVENTSIMVVDDDLALLKLVAMSLRGGGYRVLTASSGTEALRLAYQEHPDLVILDVMMPQVNGWEVCQSLRTMTDTPIIFLTACDAVSDRLKGFDAGADDYIIKPFNISELMWRVSAVLRRVEQNKPLPSRSFNGGVLEVDLEGHTVTFHGEVVSLTPKEFEVLACLVKQAGKVVTNEQILREVWGDSYNDTTDYIKVYISRLRRKLEDDPEKPRHILTQHGVGYRFQGQD